MMPIVRSIQRKIVHRMRSLCTQDVTVYQELGLDRRIEARAKMKACQAILPKIVPYQLRTVPRNLDRSLRLIAPDNYRSGVLT